MVVMLVLIIAMINEIHDRADDVCLRDTGDGNDCDSAIYDTPSNCGLYDTEHFTANQMCCNCGGGFQMDLGAFEQTWDATAPYCYENHRDKTLDYEERTCAAYYNMDESLCGSADKRNGQNTAWIFTASEMCCACGGGETRICENTDNGVMSMIHRSTARLYSAW